MQINIHQKIRLASSSPTRRGLLDSVGLKYNVASPDIDERELTQTALAQGKHVRDIALLLAHEKCKKIAMIYPDEIIIAADQILECEGAQIRKPDNYTEVFEQLWLLRGKAHHLHSAFVVGQGQKVIHAEVQTASIIMRNYSKNCLDSYLRLCEPAYQTSVGGYQIENHSMLLVDKIEGDFTTIMGLPMLPLLAVLRRLHLVCE